MIIGLTGQSGAGKTTVSQYFSELGFYVINCDEIARNATEKGSIGAEKIRAAFGNEFFDCDGILKRRHLGTICFANKEKLQKLNEILHPIIIDIIKAEIVSHKEKKYIVLDAPTLFESKANFLCDAIISIIADENSRLKRIINRDNITEELAQNRLKSQQSQQFFMDNSTYIIENNNDLCYLQNKTRGIADEIKKKNL